MAPGLVQAVLDRHRRYRVLWTVSGTDFCCLQTAASCCLWGSPWEMFSPLLLSFANTGAIRLPSSFYCFSTHPFLPGLLNIAHIYCRPVSTTDPGHHPSFLCFYCPAREMRKKRYWPSKFLTAEVQLVASLSLFFLYLDLSDVVLYKKTEPTWCMFWNIPCTSHQNISRALLHSQRTVFFWGGKSHLLHPDDSFNHSSIILCLSSLLHRFLRWATQPKHTLCNLAFALTDLSLICCKNTILIILFIKLKGTHIHVGLQLGWGGSSMEEDGWDKCFNHFFSCYHMEGEEQGLLLAVKPHQHLGWGTVLWWGLRNVDVEKSFLMVFFIFLRCHWLHCTGVEKIFPKSIGWPSPS